MINGFEDRYYVYSKPGTNIIYTIDPRVCDFRHAKSITQHVDTMKKLYKDMEDTQKETTVTRSARHKAGDLEFCTEQRT